MRLLPFISTRLLVGHSSVLIPTTYLNLGIPLWPKEQLICRVLIRRSMRLRSEGSVGHAPEGYLTVSFAPCRFET